MVERRDERRVERRGESKEERERERERGGEVEMGERGSYRRPREVISFFDS